MSSTPLKIELNIALIPDHKLAKQLVTLSHLLANQYPAIVQLNLPEGRLAMAPHLTLYQVPLFLKSVEEATQQLAAAIAEIDSFSLQATDYTYNEGEASFEVGYETTDALATLQMKVIELLNPLRRDSLLERDPAGNDMRDFLQKTDKQSNDVRKTGYWEVGDRRQGGFFRPHATLNWFEIGTLINPASEELPAVTSLSGTYDALGVYALGPNGSCPQLLTKFTLE